MHPDRLALTVRVINGLLCAVAVLCGCVASASGRSYVPPRGHLFAGLTGGTSIVPFERMVGKHPPVFELFMTWNTQTAWLSNPDPGFRSRLGLAIGTSYGYGKPGVISPEGIAVGHSDRFLVALGRNLARSRRIVYARIMGEMNGYWNAYSGFAAGGASRGAANSPKAFIRAWRRSVLILRGGAVSAINRRLHALGLPALKLRLPPGAKLARPKVAFLWVPADAGSPDIPANAPGAYWPGGAYVDWVGTDFYASSQNFTLLDRFYSEFRSKPVVLSEWGLYGTDEPGFVRELFSWVRTHRRVRMLNYYQGFTSSSPANLAHYPRSRAVLRRELRSKRFLAYPPEYAYPKRRHRQPPAPPPKPPAPALPPGPPPQQLCVPPAPLCLPGV